MKTPVRIAVTGAAGQIGYSIVFRIAGGEMLGSEQPVILQLLDITQALPALRGVVMELEDCAFPLLQGLSVSDDPKVAFRDADVALLVGARPRTKGLERKDLLEFNAAIFSTQGKALSESAKRGVKVLVVGNPANTNAYIAMKSARELSANSFTAMMRLDHNRALSQIAAKLGKPVTSIKKVTIWGNHSSTQYPDLFHAEADGQKVVEQINDQAWIEKAFIPAVQQRGTAIIEARGSGSAASAAHAAICHIRDWIRGTPEGDWVSMGIPSDGSYDIPEGVIYGYPCICRGGAYQIVQGLEISGLSRTRMESTHKELLEEREASKHLLS